MARQTAPAAARAAPSAPRGIRYIWEEAHSSSLEFVRSLARYFSEHLHHSSAQPHSCQPRSRGSAK